VAQKRRVALYGGTFDPIHLGHLEVARRLQELFALAEVLFIPAYVPPHKRKLNVSRALHRYTMLALATQHDERLRVSTIELDAPEQPYTVETLGRIGAAFGEATDVFFVMGADSWAEITTWHQWERVLNASHHIVVTRPGYEIATTHVGADVRDRIIDLRGLEQRELSARLQDSGEARIYFTDAVNADVSATKIRELAANANREQLSTLVPPPVADYILKYELYKSE
jgi:nicotinate-nucleotide adenylyltransferase